MTPGLFMLRARALHDSGRTEQAIAELRAHPEAGEWYLARALASVLADSGRVDEAIDVLRPASSIGPSRHLLAELLLQQGKVKEAAVVIRTPEPYLSHSPEDPWAQASTG
jgi:predicted Zn-dependent protease